MHFPRHPESSQSSLHQFLDNNITFRATKMYLWKAVQLSVEGVPFSEWQDYQSSCSHYSEHLLSPGLPQERTRPDSLCPDTACPDVACPDTDSLCPDVSCPEEEEEEVLWPVSCRAHWCESQGVCG